MWSGMGVVWLLYSVSDSSEQGDHPPYISVTAVVPIWGDLPCTIGAVPVTRIALYKLPVL